MEVYCRRNIQNVFDINQSEYQILKCDTHGKDFKLVRTFQTDWHIYLSFYINSFGGKKQWKSCVSQT